MTKSVGVVWHLYRREHVCVYLLDGGRLRLVHNGYSGHDMIP